ncbi:PEP-CTERM sorting domain-containing protein [Verrucomicrobiota bacterium sgz303538]
MNSPVKLFFSAVIALGTVALPQAHSTLIDFNGAGTSEFGSNFIQSGSGFAETPGVGIGGTDGLANSGSGFALYTAEAFDMTSSTAAVGSVLFYYDGGFNTLSKGMLAGFDVLSDPLVSTPFKFRLEMEMWGPDFGTGVSGYLVFRTSDTSYYGSDKGSFGSAFKIVPDHWYRLTAGFANEDGAFRISGKLEDYGTDGMQSVSTLSEGSWRSTGSHSAGANTIDTTLSTDSSAYLRAYADITATALDNFEFQAGAQVPEPSSTALLACTGLFVLNRRRAIRGVSQ